MHAQLNWKVPFDPRILVLCAAVSACSEGRYRSLGANVEPESAGTSGKTSGANGTGSSSGASGNAGAPGRSRSCAERSEKPDATNTGVPAGIALTIVEGDQTYATDGETITGMDFRGFIKVTASHVTFERCIFRGRATSAHAGLLDTEAGTDTWVEDCEFAPSNPAATVNDLWIAETTVCRANIHGGFDGLSAGNNVVIQESYIHDMSWFDTRPENFGNDGVQCSAGSAHVVIAHNNIDLSTTWNSSSAILSSATDIRVEGNWLDGGGCTLNFAHVGTPLTGIYVVSNRFGRHSSYDCPILISTQTTLTENRGNVWDDTGEAIPPPQQHD